MDVLHLDYETRSLLDLDQYGLENYSRHPSTQILLAAYAFDDRAPKLWQPHLQPEVPADLADALLSPFVEVHAWNTAFEREITRRLLNIDKPLVEWKDPMCNARYLSLPGKLETAGQILGLREDLQKIADGERLIKLFCEPEDEGGEETLFGVSEPSFRDWRTDPADWARFCEYCKRDVISERAALQKMKKFPLPGFEWANWRLSEEINTNGWPVDMATVEGARLIVQKETERLSEKFSLLTGGLNPNSSQQLLPWLRDRGYKFSSLEKAFVARAMADSDLLPEAREALEIRSQTSKTSVKKYTNIADMVGPDGRLRHQYTFMGAARTGRQAAHGVNVGNLSKPDKAVEKKMDRAIELVRLMDYEGVCQEFDKPLDVVTSTVRASFRAPEGFEFVVADLASIENVGAGFLAHSQPVLQVFRDGRDAYLDFASHFYKLPYEQLAAEYNDGKGDKSKRTMCKPATLGAGFGLGAGQEFEDAEGNKNWSGLLGYARAMNVIMTQEEAAKAVEVFRANYPEIPLMWKDLERAAKRAIKNPGGEFSVGVPHTEKERIWFEEKGRKINKPLLSFVCHGTKVLELKLPSGRSLHYIDPEITEEEYEYQGKKLVGEKISYYGKEQNSTHWGRVTTHGAKFFENADQAWARDILFNGMHEAKKEGFELVGSTYDEAIALARIGSRHTLELLCDCMTRKPSWMPDGVPLKAAGFTGPVYKKD